MLFVAYSIYVDVDATHTSVTTVLPFILLGAALVIAPGFEFVNGFHDTANAVSTVMYTYSLPAPVAVVRSGFFDILGVLVSSGAVAFGIIWLLPVELILRVGSSAGCCRNRTKLVPSKSHDSARTHLNWTEHKLRVSSGHPNAAVGFRRSPI